MAHTTVDTEIGRRIRRRRATLGMSQSKLAGELEVTFQQVQKYEKGTNQVGWDRLQTIAQVLDVPVTYFFGNRCDREPSCTYETMVDFVSSVEGLELNVAFLSIANENIRRKFVAMVKALAHEEDEVEAGAKD